MFSVASAVNSDGVYLGPADTMLIFIDVGRFSRNGAYFRSCGPCMPGSARPRANDRFSRITTCRSQALIYPIVV